MERKLTAILCADVFGYSRLMGKNEEATLRTLSSYRKLIDSLIEQHHGRFVNSAGDSVLAEFMRLNPRHPELWLSQVGLAYLSMGRFKEARTIFEEAFANFPNNPGGYMCKAVADVELGRNDEARAEAAEILRLSPHYSLATVQQVYPLKDPTMEERWLADLRKAGLK